MANGFEIKGICAFLFAVVAYFFDPLQRAALLALFILIIVDFFFGFAAAKKTGKEITSSRFARTPIKMVVYFSLVACSRISEYALPSFLAVLDETLVAFLVATELLSILEKSGHLGFAVPQKLLNQLEKYTSES